MSLVALRYKPILLALTLALTSCGGHKHAGNDQPPPPVVVELPTPAPPIPAPEPPQPDPGPVVVVPPVQPPVIEPTPDPIPPVVEEPAPPVVTPPAEPEQPAPPVVTPPTKPTFALLQATRFPGNPDMRPYGLERVQFVYTSELFSGDKSKPDPVAIAKAMRRYMAMSPRPDILVFDIEHWSLDTNSPDVAKHVEVLRLARLTWTGRLAYYGEIPVRDGTSMNGSASVTPGRMSAWRAQNTALLPLVAEVDALYPSIYPLYSDLKKWNRFAVAMVEEARRLVAIDAAVRSEAAGVSLPAKPVYAVLWIDWHNNSGLTGRVPAEVFRGMIETVKAAGADGVVIWSMARGSVPFSANEGWMQAVQQVRGMP